MALPLVGVRVLDLTRYISGPACAQFLGDFGADVIKVESPAGEAARDTPPFNGDYSLYFAAFNRNKRSISLNLRSEKGREILRGLVAKSDIFLHNFRTGVLAEIGLDFDTLRTINPRIVLVHISGFGREGKWAERPAFDDVGQAMSGLMSLTGATDRPPSLVGTFIVDHLTSLNAVIGTLIGLRQRDMTGAAQEVDVALVDSAVAALMFYLPWVRLSGQTIGRNGNTNRFYAASNTYPARDGFVHIAATRDHMWSRLARVLGRPQLAKDPEYRSAAARLHRRVEIDKLIEAWSSQLTKEEIIAALSREGVPCGPVLSLEEVLEHLDLDARGMMLGFPTAEGRECWTVGNPVRLGGNVAGIHRPPPACGQDNQNVLGEFLGISAEEAAELRRSGVI
jgi:crotonobetainyl-CoA:carnitine CoA-transferase CaiB-like acyl-CoA transferase